MKPRVSVVLTTYNARERLRFALASYRHQTYPADKFEVVIVDDGSTDSTKRWFEQQTWNFKTKYIYNSQNKGRAGAKNIGINAANGGIIIFGDCDMIAPPNYIAEHANYHKDSDDLVVCGSFWNPIYTHIYREGGEEIASAVHKLADQHRSLRRRAVAAFERVAVGRRYASLLSEETVARIIRSPLISSSLPVADYFIPYVKQYGKHLHPFYFPWIYFVVMNVSVRKKHLEKAGLFDEKLVGYGGEDTDIGYRLWQNGLRFIADPKLKNYHQEHPRNLDKQETERFHNKVYLVKKHRNTDFLLHLFVHGDNHEKSRFLNQWDRLLSGKVVSEYFSGQLDRLIWAWVQAYYPYFDQELETMDPLDEHALFAELDHVRTMPEYADFVAYVENLSHSYK